MSKRKADDLEPQSAESGDETPVESPIVKKKTVPYAPLRHTVATANAFRMSTPTAPSARSNSVVSVPRSSSTTNPLAPRTLPAQSCLVTPRATPSNAGDTFDSSDSESQETSASLAPKSNLGSRAGSASAPAPFSRLIFEKQIDKLMNAIDDMDKRNEERHQETKKWIREAKQERSEHAEHLTRTTEQLEKLFLALREWDDRFHVAFENRNSREQSELVDGTVAPVLAPAAGAVLTNPRLTEEMSECIKSALKNKPEARRDQDKNAIKEHIRVSFYAMLGRIQEASDIPPFFDDENGVVTVFPPFARNPVTGYCRPFPNWTATLDKQMEWMPTFFQSYENTIPKNNSPNSTLLRSLTKGEIVYGLSTGIFATCRSAWRQKPAFKSKDALREMQSATRQEWRLDEKLIKRISYRRELPALQGPLYDWVFRREVMSPEVSDAEGNITVQTPQWRATWVNKLFGSIDDAEHAKALSQPGLCPPRPKRNPGAGRADLPRMTMVGPNGSEGPVKVAHCGLSTQFRRANANKMEELTHLIDFESKTVPSTRAFREKYPPPAKSDVNPCNEGNVGGSLVDNTGKDEGAGDGGDLNESLGEDWESGQAMGMGEGLGTHEELGDVSGNFEDGNTADDEEEGGDEVPKLNGQANDDILGSIDPDLQDAPTKQLHARPKMIVPDGNVEATGVTTSTENGLQGLNVSSVTAPSPKASASHQSDSELDPPPTADPPPPVVDPRDPSRVIPELQPPPSLPRQQAATALATAQREAEIAARLMAQTETNTLPGKAPKKQSKKNTKGAVNLQTQLGGAGDANAATLVEAGGDAGPSAPVKKTRGRPKGSKNKPKQPNPAD